MTLLAAASRSGYWALLTPPNSSTGRAIKDTSFSFDFTFLTIYSPSRLLSLVLGLITACYDLFVNRNSVPANSGLSGFQFRKLTTHHTVMAVCKITAGHSNTPTG